MKPVVHLLGGACFAFEIVSLQRLMYNSLPLQAGLTIRYASVVDNLCFLLLFACQVGISDSGISVGHLKINCGVHAKNCTKLKLGRVLMKSGSNEI